MSDSDCVLIVLRHTGGQAEYKYPTGQLSIVSISMSGMGSKRIRVASLPPEVPNETLLATLAAFGKVLDIQAELWSKAFRYKVPNGIRQVMVMLTRHVPSLFTVAGHRVLLSSEEQPASCYGCGKIEHMFQRCPARQTSGLVRPTLQMPHMHPLYRLPPQLRRIQWQI
jgi:hypothetical protein